MNTLFQQIADQCSCPVLLKDSYQSVGWYYRRYMIYSNKGRIEIESIGDNAEDIMSLLHEQVHHLHDEKNCECMQLTNRTMAEYHAYKESLQAALKLGDKDVIKETIKLIKFCANYDYKNCHRTAARKVMRLKLWKKAL